MNLGSLLNVASSSVSSLFSGALPYVLAGSLIVGSGVGFYAGSVFYGNRYKGQITELVQKNALIQQNYDGFKIGALANAAVQNDKAKSLQDEIARVRGELQREHNARMSAERSRSNGLKEGLINAKETNALSAASIDYFKRLRGPN